MEVHSNKHKQEYYWHLSVLHIVKWVSNNEGQEIGGHDGSMSKDHTL